MAARKPRVEYYWCADPSKPVTPDNIRVNWRLVGANGEIMCQSTQGFRDEADARRSVLAVAAVREVGPGRKPA